jgi:hypothetical protein
VVDFKGLDARVLWNNRFKQAAELRNVPLSIAELIKLSANRTFIGNREGPAEGAVGETDGQIRLKYQ